jgi:transcriptional regulator with XRE-family HTH domain
MVNNKIKHPDQYRWNMREARYRMRAVNSTGKLKYLTLTGLKELLYKRYSLEYSVGYISMIESGIRNPGDELLKALSEILQIDKEKLLNNNKSA